MSTRRQQMEKFVETGSAEQCGDERVKGIEPSCAAWEAAILPLNYTRVGTARFSFVDLSIANAKCKQI
jgi:hypothetical protein